MNHYVNLEVCPDEDVPLYFIRNKIFSKLHKVLFTLKTADIGVSFPSYKTKLGDTVRIHGSEARLNELQATNWLGGLSGYCEVGVIKEVPDKIEGHRIVARIQPTMTKAKREKSIAYQKEKGYLTTEQEVEDYGKQYTEKMFEVSLDNPYLELKSSSNGNNYRVYIGFGALQSTPTEGEFNFFGLSKIATIPWF